MGRTTIEIDEELIAEVSPGVSTALGRVWPTGQGSPRVDGMTAHPVNLERKVRQLDNDVQSIYELLASIQGVQLRHTNRLDEIDRSIDALTTRLGSVETRLESIETRLESIETRLESIETRLEAVETRLESMEGVLREVLDVLRSGGR